MQLHMTVTMSPSDTSENITRLSVELARQPFLSCFCTSATPLLFYLQKLSQIAMKTTTTTTAISVVQHYHLPFESYGPQLLTLRSTWPSSLYPLPLPLSRN